jgi:hypothetical protein
MWTAPPLRRVASATSGRSATAIPTSPQPYTVPTCLRTTAAHDPSRTAQVAWPKSRHVRRALARHGWVMFCPRLAGVARRRHARTSRAWTSSAPATAARPCCGPSRPPSGRRCFRRGEPRGGSTRRRRSLRSWRRRRRRRRRRRTGDEIVLCLPRHPPRRTFLEPGLPRSCAACSYVHLSSVPAGGRLLCSCGEAEGL